MKFAFEPGDLARKSVGLGRQHVDVIVGARPDDVVEDADRRGEVAGEFGVFVGDEPSVEAVVVHKRIPGRNHCGLPRHIDQVALIGQVRLDAQQPWTSAAKVEADEHIRLGAFGVDLQQVNCYSRRDVLGPDVVECADLNGGALDRVPIMTRLIGERLDRCGQTGVGDTMQCALTRSRSGKHAKVDVTRTLLDKRGEVIRYRFDVDAPPASLGERVGDRVFTGHPRAHVDPETVLDVSEASAEKDVLEVLRVRHPRGRTFPPIGPSHVHMTRRYFRARRFPLDAEGRVPLRTAQGRQWCG